MEKIIEIDVNSKEDLFERYNKKEVSKDLVGYILEKTIFINKKDKFKVVINKNIDENCVLHIKNSLQEEYNKCLLKHKRNSIIQIIYLIVGILVLFLSTVIKDSIFKEIVLIGGWVLIWEVVELEIMSDVNIRKKRRILKKLLSSEFIEIEK